MHKLKMGSTLFILLALVIFSSTPTMLHAGPADEIANVDGASISTELFELRMSRLTQEGQGDFNTYEGKKELLDLLIAREVLNQAGIRSGLDKSKVIKDRVAELTKEFVINEMVNKIIQEKVTESAMKGYYEKNKADFGEVQASHILVKTEDEAKDVKKKLDGGAAFETLAKEVSIDPASAARGGDLGFFTRDRMVKTFADAAFAMEKGEVSGPVKSPFGYHIIHKMESRPPGDYGTLTPAQLQALRGTMINWEIDQLKAKAKVTVNDEALRKAALSPPPMMPGMPGMDH